MKKNLFKALCLSALLALQTAPTRAEDIDLFAGANQSTVDLPNVLFLVDNTANWSQPFKAEMEALINAFNSLPADKFRVGMMMFTETGKGDAPGTGSSDGAYLRAAIRTMDSTTQTKYSDLIKSLDSNADKSNGGKAGKNMVEVYRYLNGSTPYAGNNKVKTDFNGNSGVSTASDAIYALTGNALRSKGGTTYTAPPANGCGGTFVIYISNGPVQDNNSDTTAATNELKAAGTGKALPADLADWTTPIVISPSGSQDNVSDEWARFMSKTMGVTFFTIDVVPKATGQTPGWSALLRSIAKESQGTYYDLSKSTDLQKDMENALGNILSKIQAVNSAFSSVSLPVSVNTQGTYLNQVFMAMFRPDGSARPRWHGNLKQYKVGVDPTTSQLFLADASSTSSNPNGANAVNPKTGFIDSCARSFWTPSAADTYWNFAPSRDYCLAVANSDTSNSPDGPNVEKGAQAYMLRSTLTASRNVKTCSDSTCTALGNFDASNTNITQAALDPTPSSTNRATLINWARGLDNKGDERYDSSGKPLTSTTAMRPSVHGDVIHSRPVAINYGTDVSPQVVVFYGGNDGTLRAVAGNRTAAASTGAAAGSELWSFMPPEFYGSIKRLYDNSPRVNYPNLLQPTGDPTPQPKPYGMDGPVTAYQSSDGTTAWIYASMRRGGRSIYAFDVSTMGSPTIKWRRGCPNSGDDTSCTTGMSGIGQTWSPPKVFLAPGYGSGKSPMVIFGGGYDKCEDADTGSTCDVATKGNHIYVLDADTGAVLKTFDTLRGVVGDITVVNDATTGKAKIAYAADLGGNVYRIDLMGDSAKAPGAWTLTQVASLGCDTVTTCTPNRKFMFGPDVLEDNGAYVILLGSGDREKPLRYYTNAFNEANYFFMVVDKPSNSTWLTSQGTATTDSSGSPVAAPCGAGKNVMCLASLLNIGSSNPDPNALAAKKGWYLSLATGEQVVTSSVTAYGNTTFSTHIPVDPTTTQSCKSDLGKAQVYNVSYLNASNPNGRYQDVLTGGLSPSPVLATVQLDDKTTRNVCFGCAPIFPPPVDVGAPKGIKQTKGRVYWFNQR